ncbi:hypothetical protein HF086_016290 [Spodoptera exigua]|uniref:BED-type domain-containing protein n=1 Tax=Spodoptera exigua TaxID=7107 RepID=A0A922MHY5_SPOEX|nr:hypothetical protein HF086_016290 [Spodoptera exigua]
MVCMTHKYENGADNIKFAVCTLCNVNISRGGEGTSAMKNHLKLKHPNEYKTISKGQADIAEMIALDNEPLSVVIRTGFTRLLQQALPRYKMPSRTYIAQKIIPDIYDRIHDKIKENISSAFGISVTYIFGLVYTTMPAF